MPQLDALLVSVGRQRVRERMVLVVDTCVGAQGNGKSIKDHLGELSESVGLPRPGAKTAQDFLRDFAKGI